MAEQGQLSLRSFAALSVGELGNRQRQTSAKVSSADASDFFIKVIESVQTTFSKPQSLPIVSRKLPRQAHSLKSDLVGVVDLGRNVRGGTLPRLSCDRSVL